MTKRRNVKNDENGATDGHERSKNFLNDEEMALLLAAAKKGRHNIRDYLLLLMTYRHGLRVNEVISLKISDLNLAQARLWVECHKK